MIPVSVIIPVYNAFDATLECIQSVLEHSPDSDLRVFAIDDASSEGQLEEYLPDTVLADKRLHVLRNLENRGFTGTCNRGMLVLSGSDDVILLNSDTVVTPRWIEKLQAASLSQSNIATVTALTNNGIICSVPRFCEDNELPSGLSLQEFSDLVEHVSRRTYPALPTCVGFCAYIRREVIDSIGGLDERAFPKGYGEENDFSCRAQDAGFHDVVDDATFILHKGGLSFGDSQHELRRSHGKVLNERHPRYERRVAEFCRTNPLRDVHAAIWNGLIAKDSLTPKPVVLHLLHNGPSLARRHGIGGTERHVLDLVKGVSEAHHWTVSPGEGPLDKPSLHLSYFRNGVERAFDFPPGALLLKDLLSFDFFDVVHVHHSAGFDRSMYVEAVRKHGRYVVSLHDHWWICPRTFLLTPELRPCSLHECSTSCGEGQLAVERFREDARQLLDGAAQVVTFSEHVRHTFAEFSKVDDRWKLIPHGRPAQGRPPAALTGTPYAKRDSEKLRALILGTLVPHKGLHLLQESLKLTVERSLKIDWHLLGTCSEPLNAGLPVNTLSDHGQYSAEDVCAKIHLIDPDIIVLASLAAETFSMTLSEAWSCGVPVVVTPRGALRERVQSSGAGIVLGEASAGALVDTLERLRTEPSLLQSYKDRTLTVPLPSLFEECRSYGALYNSLWSERTEAPPMLELIGALQPELLPPGLRTKSARRITPRRRGWNLSALYAALKQRRISVEETLSRPASN